ncbi:hypothetical protein V5E82_004065 [Yersinia enterocolitica]
MMDAIAVYSIMGIYLMGYFSGRLDEEENISSAWALPAAILWPILVIGGLSSIYGNGGENERD